MKLIRSSLLFSFLFVFCTQNKHDFKIERKDHIEIAQNNRFPKYDNQENLFKADFLFAIGKENENNYMFHNPSFIGLDREKNIFVLDRGNFRIQMYDSTGKFIQSLGRKGSGPGEFLNPWKGYVSAQHNKLVIYDTKNRRFDIFKTSGVYVKSYQPKESILVHQVFIDSDGNILSLEQKTTKVKNNQDPLRKVLRLVRYNKEFTNHSILFESKLYTRSEYQYIWSQRQFAAFSSAGLIYLPSPERDQYTINVLNSDGKLIRKIQKESQLKPLTQEDIEKKKRANKMKQSLTGFTVPIPTHYPPFYNLSIDQKDRLLVYASEETGIGLDIFDKQGQYLYRAKEMPILGDNIRKNKVYAFLQEKGYPQLFVYKIVDYLK